MIIYLTILLNSVNYKLNRHTANVSNVGILLDVGIEVLAVGVVGSVLSH